MACSGGSLIPDQMLNFGPNCGCIVESASDQSVSESREDFSEYWSADVVIRLSERWMVHPS